MESASALIRLVNSLTIKNKNLISSEDVSCLSASLCGKRSMCAREIEVMMQVVKLSEKQMYVKKMKVVQSEARKRSNAKCHVTV